MANTSSYETVIGLEVHVQLATQSKAFCADDAAFGAPANTHISAISLGHPGTLPKLNKKQVEFAVRLGHAIGSEINANNSFDRKNYFYADLPKGYQLTQDRAPICIGGKVAIKGKNFNKEIRIHHVHMEEDAGKSIHDIDPKHSLIDLNRAGVPLLEIVTEPDFRSPEEVDVFMTTMRQLVRYLEISDGNMEEGSLRCDVNISLRKKGATEYGERCEVKNVNSMRFARQAIEFEAKRQADILDAGGIIQRNTLNFDPATGVTSPLRAKEDANDYRYFPAPDLTPLELSAAFIEKIKNELPPLPAVLYQQFTKDFALSEYNANLLTQEKPIALFFLKLSEQSKNYKGIANLLINKVIPFANEQKIALSEFPLSAKTLTDFVQLIEDGKVSSSLAYQRLFPALVESPDMSPLALAEQMGMVQDGDDDFVSGLVDAAIANNPDKVKAYQSGKKNLIGFFMGEIVRASKGKADPKAVNALLREKLG